MSASLAGEFFTPLTGPSGDADDGYMRVRDVLELHRQHWPGAPHAFEGFRSHRELEDDCRVVLGKEIRQYYAAGTRRWASYAQVAQEFRRQRDTGSPAKRSPYSYEVVFAPVRVVLAESDRPIRAFLSHDPVYPANGKLGTVRTPWSLAPTYLALAVLNSAIGLGYYHSEYESQRGGHSRSSDGLVVDVLERVPVAHREVSFPECERAAQLAFTVSMLCQAEQECHEDFSEYLFPLRLLLLSTISAVLRLPEGEPDRLIESVRHLHPTDAPEPQLRLYEALQLFPVRDRVVLMSPEDHQRLDLLGERSTGTGLSRSELSELNRLLRKSAWEKRVNAFRGKDGSGEGGNARPTLHPLRRHPVLSQVVLFDDPVRPLSEDEWPEEYR